jgi:hypothetical protein
MSTDHSALVDELIGLILEGVNTLAARLRGLKDTGKPLQEILNSLSVSLDLGLQFPGLVHRPCGSRVCPCMFSQRRRLSSTRLRFALAVWNAPSCCWWRVPIQTPKM